MSLALVMIIVLVIIVVVLILYNLSIHNKIKKFNDINDRITNLNVLQDFLDTIGKDDSVDNKLQKINNILIEKFQINYSTLVIFDGAEYTIKATNVSEEYWEIMKNLHTDEMFKDSITSVTPKYVTINNPREKLEYQKNQMGRAKSAMFFPLYVDNIYIGYWIIESNIAHAFDNIDTNVLGIVRENIVSILKSVSYQNTIENIYRIDQYTGLNSGEYLYGKGRRIINKYTRSTICMFRISNIEGINKTFGREIGTKALIDATNIVKRNISSEYIFVRYMGPKFAIAFSGVEIDAVESFIKNLKEEIERITIIKKVKQDKTKNKKKQEIWHIKTNFALAPYYKGLGIEEVTKKLEQYLDDADKEESNISII